MHGNEDSIILQTHEPIKVVIPRGSISQVKTEIIPRQTSTLTAPIDANTPLADIVVSLHDVELGKFPVYAEHSVTQAGWFKRQWQNASYYFNGWIDLCKQSIFKRTFCFCR